MSMTIRTKRDAHAQVAQLMQRDARRLADFP
jgi:hypothetical protein